MKGRARSVLAGALLGGLVLAGCSGGDEQDDPGPAADCTTQKNLVVLAWADGAGLIPEDASPNAWIQQHPDSAAFDEARTDDGAIDIARMWAEREEHPDRWNDLLRYYDNVGRSWLTSTHLDDIVGGPGDTEADTNGEVDALGWSVCAATG